MGRGVPGVQCHFTDTKSGTYMNREVLLFCGFLLGIHLPVCMQMVQLHHFLGSLPYFALGRKDRRFLKCGSAFVSQCRPANP